MDVVYRLGEATAASVEEALDDPPSNATVRSTLRVLEDKGWITHRRDRGRYVYRPVRDREQVSEGVLRHVVETYFEDSPSALVAALLDRRGARLRRGERERLHDLLAAMEARDKAP